MRVAWLGVGVLLILVSCGLETVESLNAPPVSYSSSTLVTNKSVSFVHSASRYSTSTTFLGYQVFYKIYPYRNIDDFAQLVADQSLVVSKTVVQLKNLGYYTLSISGDNSGNSSTAVDGLLIQGVPDAALVTIDFTDFLDPAVSKVNNQPVLKVNGVAIDKPFLYRDATIRNADSKHLSFSGLRTETMTVSNHPADISSTTTALGFQNRSFEVNLFIAAYGVTPSLVEVFSEPVPWGVIRVIEP